MLEYSRKILELLGAPAAPKAFDRLVVSGIQMQDQLPVAREPEVARLARVIARWRSAWASMPFEKLVCVEILLTVAAPEFRWPVWIVAAEPVCIEEGVAVERHLTRDAVEAFGYEQIDMGLHLLVHLQGVGLIEVYATRPASS